MTHTVEAKRKLINRFRRLRGQLDALERALEAEERSEELMQLLVASRGAVDVLMVEVVEGYVRSVLLYRMRPFGARAMPFEHVTVPLRSRASAKVIP